MEAAALGLGERSEQVFLDLLGSVSSLLEPAAATSGEPDEIAAAIGRIAAPKDELFGLEAVDHGHQVAGVDAELLPEAALRDRAGFRERVEDGELVRMHAKLAKRRAEAYRRCAPETKHEQVAGARIGIAVDRGRWTGGRRVHVGVRWYYLIMVGDHNG